MTKPEWRMTIWGAIRNGRKKAQKAQKKEEIE
jgi:hypothetical protein